MKLEKVRGCETIFEKEIGSEKISGKSNRKVVE